MKTRLERLIDDAHSAIQNAPVTPGTTAAEKVLECVKELARQVSKLKKSEAAPQLPENHLGGPVED
jgi:hypothetical protein